MIWSFYLSSFVRIITADSISMLPRTDRMQNSKAKLKISLSGYYHLTLRWNLRSLGSGTNGCWIEFNIYTKVSAPNFLNIIQSVLMFLSGYYRMTVQCYSLCKTVILRKKIILFNYLCYWLFSFYRKLFYHKMSSKWCLQVSSGPLLYQHQYYNIASQGPKLKH